MPCARLSPPTPRRLWCYVTRRLRLKKYCQQPGDSRTRAHRIRTTIIAKLPSPATSFRNGCFHRKPGARLVTVDGVWTTDQSRVAKYPLSRDRGRFMRTADAYQKLATSVFPRIKSNIRHDLLRIPYTLIILECTR
jgi:hypothetical protein